jgi:hypothetical protein
MCCRTVITPVPKNWQEIVRLAGFKRGSAGVWTKDYGSSIIFCQKGLSQGSIWMPMSQTPETGLLLMLWPPISDHSMEQHTKAGYAASVLFKVAMTLGERGRYEITQMNLVGKCLYDNHDKPTRQLAAYPERPLLFQNLCLGFRTVLGRGIPNL